MATTNVTLPKLWNARQSVDLTMLCQVLGREAGNQQRPAVEAVACSIRNRVSAGLIRWGIGWENVIEKRWQYSSIDGAPNDPNLRKYPNLNFAPWPLCLDVAEACYSGDLIDATGGAHSYFDRSLDSNPPSWADPKVGEFIFTKDVGDFHFYRLATIR